MSRCAAALLVLLAAPGAHGAQPARGTAWPAKPIRFIVPFPGGSASDAAARVVAAKIGDALGQQVVIDNRAGASGNIGVELGARATPDGYTLTLGTTSTHTVAPSVNADLTYDPVRDFAPISPIGGAPYVLAVPAAIAAANLKEFIALAKSKPRQLSYASAGNASLAHLAGEFFSTMAGVQLNHIPYKSSANAVVDLMSGRIDLQFGSIAPVLPHIRSGRLRALATTGAARLAALPEVPTMIEASLRGYDISLWYGMFAPRATPAAVVTHLNRELVAALGTNDVKDALNAQGLEPAPMAPAAFATLIRSETDKYRRIARTVGIRAE